MAAMLALAEMSHSPAPAFHVVAMQVEGDSLLIGRHIHHSAFPLADMYFSQSDEEEVWEAEYTTCSALPRAVAVSLARGCGAGSVRGVACARCHKEELAPGGVGTVGAVETGAVDASAVEAGAVGAVVSAVVSAVARRHHRGGRRGLEALRRAGVGDPPYFHERSNQRVGADDVQQPACHQRGRVKVARFHGGSIPRAVGGHLVVEVHVACESNCLMCPGDVLASLRSS
jgi:hypothetical protein